MWRIAVASSILIAVPAPAFAAEWWWITMSGQKPNLQLGFIDKSSFTSDYSGRISAWDFEINEVLVDSVRKSKTLYRFDCHNRTMTALEAIDYGNNDTVVRTNTWESYQQTPSNIVPDSVGEAKWQFVCANKSPATEPIPGSPEEFAAFIFRNAK